MQNIVTILPSHCSAMSSDTSSSDDEEKGDPEKPLSGTSGASEIPEGDVFLFAMPITKAHIESESQVEVSNSPAFQCLEEMFQQGRLTGTEVAQLKARYIELYDTLKQSRENEFRLLQQAKRYTGEVENQQDQLAKAEKFPDGCNTEVSRLREQLLKYRNEEIQSNERNYETSYQIECLLDEKRLIEREYLRMPKADVSSWLWGGKT